MPFGLTNAHAAFQRFMNDIFSDMLDVHVIIYLDDILVYSDNPTEHKKHVHEVFVKTDSTANQRNVTLTKTPSTTLALSCPKMVQTIQDWPEPRNVKDIQSFLGFANFYRCFISNYSDIVVPLTWLTRRGVPWNFSDAACKSFQSLKTVFTTAPILTHWIPDKQLIIKMDASDYALDAILSLQLDSGEIHPVAFHSCTFTPPELNYDTHDKELLAIFEAFRVW